jgi:hypothetical protein
MLLLIMIKKSGHERDDYGQGVGAGEAEAPGLERADLRYCLRHSAPRPRNANIGERDNRPYGEMAGFQRPGLIECPIYRQSMIPPE